MKPGVAARLIVNLIGLNFHTYFTQETTKI